MKVLRRRNIFFGDPTVCHGFMAIEVELDGNSPFGDVQVGFSDIQFADSTGVKNWEPLSRGLEWVSQEETLFERCFIYRVDDIMVLFHREEPNVAVTNRTAPEDNCRFIKDALKAANPGRANWTNDVDKLMSIT